MNAEVKKVRNKLRKTLPHSRMVYPERPAHLIKYHFWRVYTPLHPFVRDLALALRIVKFESRSERFPLGTVAPHSSVEKLVHYLVSRGYAYHRVAWEDNGELVGMRRVENFLYQYHIRIYEDGEVRGHYEFTPEAYPILHLNRIGQEARREEFLELLKARFIEYNPADRAQDTQEFLRDFQHPAS